MGWRFVEVAGVATDSRDRVFVFNRGDHPVIIFDREGRFIGSWGEGLFVRPHGITIGPDDAVYCTDDLDHTVKKFTPEGKLLLTLGTSGCPSDTGATSMDFRTIRHAGPPFHYPTNLALAADGSMYISDGYGNARIHQVFARRHSPARPGASPGQGPASFGCRTGSPWGRTARSSWPTARTAACSSSAPTANSSRNGPTSRGPARSSSTPTDACTSRSWATARGCGRGRPRRRPDATGGRVSVFDRDGRLLARWGGGSNPCAPGDFFAPHDLCLDSRGDLYVGEVTWSAGGNRGDGSRRLPLAPEVRPPGYRSRS